MGETRDSEPPDFGEENGGEPDVPASSSEPPTLLESRRRWNAASSLPPLPPLDEILPEHIHYVQSVVARFGVSPTHAREDLVQEVLIQAHKSRKSHIEVRALLFGITRHLVYRWAAKQETERQTNVAHARSRSNTTESAEEKWQAEERRQAVRASVARMPRIFREVFTRVELDHMTMPEIAKLLGIPVNTGYTRLHLARARFLEALRRYLARRRIRKEDLSAPVVAAAASVHIEGEAPPAAGAAATTRLRAVMSILETAAPYLGGTTIAASAIALALWLSPARPPPPLITPEPKVSVPDRAEPEPKTSGAPPSLTTSAPAPSAKAPPPVPVPRIPAPTTTAPIATASSSAAPPSPPASGTDGEDAFAHARRSEGTWARSIVGLARAGKREEAQREAARFRKAHPNSTFHASIDQALAEN